jgi:hypothetical protein
MFKKFSSCYKIMRFVTIIELYSEWSQFTN